MIARGEGGKIINVGSMYSVFGPPGYANDASVKTGILGLTKALAVELGADDIEVNAILPGWHETELTKGSPQSEWGERIRRKTGPDGASRRPDRAAPVPRLERLGLRDRRRAAGRRRLLDRASAAARVTGYAPLTARRSGGLRRSMRTNPVVSPAMRCGIILTAGDPLTSADLAAEAEAAGWDGVFTWDGIAVGAMDTYDPWVTMAAMAMRTSRVRLGAIVTPPARRRPWKLAREAMSVDRLSGGRLVLPVGLGALDDGAFGNVGEATDRRIRAQRLDETLAILEGLWSGEPFAFEGGHYRFGPMTFRPTPVQRPRVPIWVVGAWPAGTSMARALRYDGLLPNVLPAAGTAGALTPELVREMRDWIAARRSLDGFDIVVEGTTPADDPAAAGEEVRRWRDAGATWWTEADWETGTVDRLRARIAAGPPGAVGGRGA